MRLWALLLLASAAHAKKPPFDLPAGWQASPVEKTDTAAAPVEDHVWELQHPRFRGQVIIYAAKVADADLEAAAAERHAARVKNRVAWGMKAQAGPPREALRISPRRAVRWHDHVGGALGTSEQVMTCVVAGTHLACVITIGPTGDEAETAAAQVLQSLKR